MKTTSVIALLALAGTSNAACVNTYKVSRYNTCDKITQHFGTKRADLHKLNDELDCKYDLPKGKEVCISREAPKPCNKIYTARDYEYDTCREFQEVFKVTQEELVRWNVNLDCDQRISGGREICVGQEIKPCKESYRSERSHGHCEYIQNRLGISQQELHRLNHDLECNQDKPLTICLSAEEPKPCTKVYKINEFTKCREIWTAFQLSQLEFNRLNVELACNDQSAPFSKGTEVCVSKVEPKKCLKTYAVGEHNTCEKIALNFSLTKEKLHRTNNKLDCSGELPQGKEICLSTDISNSCTKKYSVFEYTTCAEIENIFEVSHKDFIKMNPNLDCSGKILEDREVCVRENSTIAL